MQGWTLYACASCRGKASRELLWNLARESKLPSLSTNRQALLAWFAHRNPRLRTRSSKQGDLEAGGY